MTLVLFVNTDTDLRVLDEFGSIRVVRTTPELAKRVRSVVGSDAELWVDGLVDGYENWPGNDRWRLHMARFREWETLGERRFQENPRQRNVDDFVHDLLDECRRCGADWISVPQVPVPDDSSRNKLNRMLATAAGKWKVERGFKGTFLLPVLLRKPKQVDKKGTRDFAVKLASQCFPRSGATGFWGAAVGLDDQAGTAALGAKRFKGVIDLHAELNAKLPDAAVHVGGPYWALNLALWARGMSTHVAAGAGVGFRYIAPGGPLRPGSSRVALPPLRRMALVNDALHDWFREVRTKVTAPPAKPGASR